MKEKKKKNKHKKGKQFTLMIKHFDDIVEQRIEIFKNL